MKEAQYVNVDIFSLLGSKVKTVVSNEHLTKGVHQFSFEKANLSNGMYIVKVFNKEMTLSKKIVLVE